jgi:FKBP-type peptidyl-prolyl cis-trans isomerase
VLSKERLPPMIFHRMKKKNVTPVMQQMPRQLFIAISALSWTEIPYVTPSFADTQKTKDLDLPIFKTSDTGLKYLEIKEGSGPEATKGCKITFHYIGRLAGRQGKIFEDTYADEPYRITLGTDKIIPGLQEGLMGMREGGKRRLLIPSSLAYSDT